MYTWREIIRLASTRLGSITHVIRVSWPPDLYWKFPWMSWGTNILVPFFSRTSNSPTSRVSREYSSVNLPVRLGPRSEGRWLRTKSCLTLSTLVSHTSTYKDTNIALRNTESWSTPKVRIFDIVVDDIWPLSAVRFTEYAEREDGNRWRYSSTERDWRHLGSFTSPPLRSSVAPSRTGSRFTRFRVETS